MDLTNPFDDRSERFRDAWDLVDEAKNSAGNLANSWNLLIDREYLFETSVYVDDEGEGRLHVYVDDNNPSELDSFERGSRHFIQLLLLAGGKALATAAQCVSGAFSTSDEERLKFLPLCKDPNAFKRLVNSGLFSGLRHDQIQLLEQFQPYEALSADNAALSHLRRYTLHLYDLAQLLPDDDARTATFWGHSASPEVVVDPPHSVTDIAIQPDGTLAESHLVAKFRVPPEATGVAAAPKIAIDPIFNAAPWPDNPDDNMHRRSRLLVRLIEEFTRALERSVGLRKPLHEGHFQLRELPYQDPLWARVDVSDTPDIEVSLRSSELGLATYRAGNEFILLVQCPDGIYGRIVPEPEAIENGIHRGPAAEIKSLDSASRWGLPDFVLEPEVIKRGNATREVGDGTIICGDRGIAVQVKARTQQSEQSDRERRWIDKKTKEGARQAAGSVRTNTREVLAHTNGRGRSIIVAGSAIEWVGVVIIDHDNPPDDLFYAKEDITLPYVALFRREWDFIFDHLRSTTAVVDYLHRIAHDDVSPGGHVAHYYELALADERTTPNHAESRIPQSLIDPMLQMSHPLLPLEPASAADEYGALIYRQILDDIACSPWDEDERERLRLLHLLDRLPVRERAVVGRKLLTHLGNIGDIEVGTTRWDARRYLLGNAEIQLGYVVTNHFTQNHQEAFRQWTMLRHHDWTIQLDSSCRQNASTVAVMLTPRHDTVRPWDTTVFALIGDLNIESDDLNSMRNLWDRGHTP